MSAATPARAGDRALTAADVDTLDFDKAGGLIPAVIQHAASGAVLMVGYLSREALRETLARGRAVFFSRGRGRLWEKGETSGHALEVEQVLADCDRDALLIIVRPRGPVCHEGTLTCFGDEFLTAAGRLSFLDSLAGLIGERLVERPDGSYTARLAASGAKRVAQKVGEEGLEVALAGAGGTDAELVAETADLLYHLLVLLAVRGVPLERAVRELRARHAAAP